MKTTKNEHDLPRRDEQASSNGVATASAVREGCAHTPGPWRLREDRTEFRITPDWNGQPGAVALTIGSTALSFRPRRSGSRRGEKMVYHPFSDQDRADARLIVAAPELLAALKAMMDGSYGNPAFPDENALVEEEAAAAIAKAEGR